MNGAKVTLALLLFVGSVGWPPAVFAQVCDTLETEAGVSDNILTEGSDFIALETCLNGGAVPLRTLMGVGT